MANVTTHIRTTCPRDCYDTCGIVVVKKNNKIMHVRGDPTHPVNRGKLCAKCSISYNREWHDPDIRLTHPLRRIGPKGAGQFEPVSWETALTTIAERFTRIVATSGAQTILNAHYTGTISLLAYLFPLRFFFHLGATEVDPDTICNKAGQVALTYLYGTPLVGFDPRTARAEADGHPRVPLPLADPRPGAGHLRLLSPASPWLLNDSFANVEKIAARIGPATVAVHPLDAAERGLTKGDEVVLSNETGQLRVHVTLSANIPRGVALSYKGRWPHRESTRANVNVLNPGRKADMGDSTAVHSIEVAVSPAPRGGDS